MKAFLDPPAKIPWYLRLGIWFADRATGKAMLLARLLAWYPKAALGSGVMEALVAHKDSEVSPRLLKLTRLQASYAPGCAFCVDMNAFGSSEAGVTDQEVKAIAQGLPLEGVASFSAQERVALEYARLISATPLRFPPDFVARLHGAFTPRQIVILASTAAQVNYWARLSQSLGVPPAGFSPECELPRNTP